MIAAFAAVYIVWGSTYLAIRYAVMTMPPLIMGGARFLVSGTILYVWARSRGAARLTPREWRDSTIAGTLMLCIGNGGVAWAEQRVPSGVAALIVAVVPLWMVLIDWLRPRGIRPRALVMLGVVIGLAGLVVLIGPRTIVGQGDVDAAATAVLMVGALSWAAGSIFNRHGARPASSAMATGAQMLGGSLVMLAAGAALGELRGFRLANVSALSWAGWSYLVTFGSLIGFTAYIYLLGAVSPAKASTYAYVNPMVAVLLGWAIAGEAVTARTAAAAAIIVVGVAMISLSGSRLSRSENPTVRASFCRSPSRRGP
ncbi:MAG TPA: EamA family transporter [Gemmatimonadaceae bacterium]|nr:EamA family transporter [Gemmatimonadaceae bacterium]